MDCPEVRIVGGVVDAVGIGTDYRGPAVAGQWISGTAGLTGNI